MSNLNRARGCFCELTQGQRRGGEVCEEGLSKEYLGLSRTQTKARCVIFAWKEAEESFQIEVGGTRMMEVKEGSVGAWRVT